MKPIVTNKTDCYLCIYRESCKHFRTNWNNWNLLRGIAKHCKDFTYPIVKSGITELLD